MSGAYNQDDSDRQDLESPCQKNPSTGRKRIGYTTDEIVGILQKKHAYPVSNDDPVLAIHTIVQLYVEEFDKSLSINQQLGKKVLVENLEKTLEAATSKANEILNKANKENLNLNEINREVNGLRSQIQELLNELKKERQLKLKSYATIALLAFNSITILILTFFMCIRG